MSFYTHDNTVDSPINNFATLNPLEASSSGISDGNLKASASGTGTSNMKYSLAGIPLSNEGSYYFEVMLSSTYNGFPVFGLAAKPISSSLYVQSKMVGFRPVSAASNRPRWTIDGSDSGNYLNGTGLSSGNIIQFYISEGKVWAGINNTFYGHNGGGSVDYSDMLAGLNPAYTIPEGDDYFPYVSSYNSTVYFNFGQDHTFGGAKTGGGAYTDANGLGQFYYEPPEGALTLCTANIPEGPIKISEDDVPADYFKTVIWTGNGSYPRSISTEFAPDLIWTKTRSALSNGVSAIDHLWMDSVRGDGNLKWISSSQTNQEGTYYGNADADLTSSGFTIQSIGGTNCLNDNNAKFVAWCWRAAGAPADNQALIINEDGSAMDATAAEAVRNSGSIVPNKISANRKSGFSIVKYTGTGSAATIPHGLNSAPDFMIVKCITVAQVSTNNWHVYHRSAGTGYLYLNLPYQYDSNWTRWNSTNPNSQLIYLGGDSNYFNVENNINFICYAWHSVAGYSKFSSYVGNGSADGPYVECGFRPSFLMARRINGTADWFMIDNARNPYNPINGEIYANRATAEDTSDADVDFLSGGFKIRRAATNFNDNGSQHIFVAFAEQPQNAPSNAR